MSLQTYQYAQLETLIAESSDEVGRIAADDFAKAVHAGLTDKDEIAVILSTGNSQLSFFNALCHRKDIPWNRITILNADEYVGLAETDSGSLSGAMRKSLVSRVKPKRFSGIQGNTEPVEKELERYTSILQELDPLICVLGIGENGHLAFNDPPADFETSEYISVVDLDHQCRMQQVGEGHFPSLEVTPTKGLSVSVPALLKSKVVLVVVPERRKASAVRTALEGPVTEQCPASILQKQTNAKLYLDPDSASLLQAVK